MNKPIIDLRPDFLDIVRNILHDHLSGQKVWIFGSRVQGRAKPASDLDIAIDDDQEIDPLLLAKLQEAFSESDLPIKVDIVDLTRTSTTFREIINQQKVPFAYW